MQFLLSIHFAQSLHQSNSFMSWFTRAFDWPMVSFGATHMHVWVNTQTNIYTSKESNAHGSTITFSQFDSPSSPLFKSLQVIKFYDLAHFILLHSCTNFHNQLLPIAFHSIFTKVNIIHNYNTRLTAKHCCCLPFVSSTSNYVV